MQVIERGGYSREEILSVLHSKDSPRRVRFRYDLLDKNGRFKKTLDCVQSGEVSMSALSTIKRTARFRIEEKYIPEHIGREENTETVSYDSSFSDWTVVSGGSKNGSLKIDTPADTVAPNWQFESFQANGVATGWQAWNASNGTFGSSQGVIGFCQRITKNTTASSSIGVMTSSYPLSVTAGQYIYLSFFFRSNAGFLPNYLYAMTQDSGTDNWRFGTVANSNVTITELNSGWFRCDAYLQAPANANVAPLIGFSTSSTGSLYIDSVYFQKNIAPRYEAVIVSPEINFADGTYMGNDVSRFKSMTTTITQYFGQYNSSMIDRPTNIVEGRYSLDYGQTWSNWVELSGGQIGIPQGVDASKLLVQFRWKAMRYNHTDEVRLDSLTSSVTVERDVYVPESPEINYLTDRIQPFMEIQMPDGQWIEYPLGVFMLSTPTRQDGVSGVYRDIEAYDELIILDDDKFTSRYLIPAGTKYTKAVEDILISAGITKFNIQDKADVLTVDKEFKIGTSKLEAINELLSAINYTPLWVDANGFFTAYPYVSPANRRADYTYADDEISILYNGMEEELDLSDIANAWVVTQSNPEKAPLVSVKVNNSPESPTSTVNLGRTIVDFREVDDIADQATLDAYVERIAFEASQVFGKLRFKTALIPFHEYSDVLWIKYDALKIDDKFSETSWKMKLEVGGEMEHEVRRVVNIG